MTRGPQGGRILFLHNLCGRSILLDIEEDYEPIIDIETWEAVQVELERRDKFCKDHFTNAYSQRSEVNPFYGKIICGN